RPGWKEKGGRHDRLRFAHDGAGNAESADEAVATTAIPRLWGIGDAPWLWATRIRILFVIDGRINEGHSEEDFGLGPVLDTLRNRWFAWWVLFTVDVVKRDPPTSFRFTQEGFNIDAYDQVWFFGDWPGLDANLPTAGDDLIGRPDYSPMADDELRVLAEWMERGGGVFAAGDHTLLGASMCSRIPRVRTMRRWTRAQGVPEFANAARNETLVHFTHPLAEEGDRWPQQIYPVYRVDPSVPWLAGRSPHPLLCGEKGVIDHFPDHMHEGAVFEDDDVLLDQPLGIAGYNGLEYPEVPIVVGPTATAAASGAFRVPEPFRNRPVPHVVAHGLTTNRESTPRRFGMIGAYAGDSVGLGRVVVDSTWHHWFSMNLVGFRDEAPSLYRGMQNYYRNVALWLATPEQRASMLFAATWGTLVGKHPGAFSHALTIWELGERVVDVIGRTAPQCIVSELAGVFARRRPTEEKAAKGRVEGPRLTPTADLVNQAIVGGIASGLLDLAHHHFTERAYGRETALDEEAIRQGALDGVIAGTRALADAVTETAAELVDLATGLSEPVGEIRVRDIPIGAGYVDQVSDGAEGT
ncbi:MAG: hypothetical protein M3313_13335, partial [Actinomycetota bacterium]|nr:hypothetical protein [Actinomycetota bacterium]